MIWNMAGVFRHGDNPWNILGKYISHKDTKQYLRVHVAYIQQSKVRGDHTYIGFDTDKSAFALTLYDTSEGIAFYVPDDKKYLTITDLNPTLVGQTITNNRTGESMKVKTLATYYDGRTQVSSDGIVRYISQDDVFDWYIVDTTTTE